MLSNFQIVGSVYSLTFNLWNPFSHHSVIDVEKNDYHYFKFWFRHSYFFHSWWCWNFWVYGLALSSRCYREWWYFPSIQTLHLTSQENVSRSVDEWAFNQGWNVLGPTSHRLSSCSFCHAKFFWQFLYRRLQSQQWSEYSYDDLHAQCHRFWLLFVELKLRLVDLDIGHLWCSLSLQKSVYTVGKHTHYIEPIALSRSFFFNLTRNFTLIHCSCFSSHIVTGTRRNTFVSNFYGKNTNRATKKCFCIEIVDTSSYPTLLSFPLSSLECLLRVVSLFNSHTLYRWSFCKIHHVQVKFLQNPPSI